MKSIQSRFKCFQGCNCALCEGRDPYLIRPVFLRLRASSLISQPFAVRDLSKTGHANLTSLRTMLPTTVQIFYMVLPHTTSPNANHQPQTKPKQHLYCAALRASSSVDSSLSGPNDMGKSCSRVMTVYLPSLSYINIGVLGYEIQSAQIVQIQHTQLGR